MPIQLNAPGWTIRRPRTSRGATQEGAAGLLDLPRCF
jgi:hypothetical protein